MATTISIKGLDKLERKLGAIRPAMVRGIKASTQHIHGLMKVYPPQTAANQPKEYEKGRWNTWYERSWGPKWALAGGGWHGKKISENLKASWTMKVINSGLTGIIGNDTSYGPYVQGGSDAPHKQTDVMRGIGWKNTDEVAAEEAPRVMKLIQGEIEKELKK